MTPPASNDSARRVPSPEAVAALRQAAALLDVEEIVDLCFAFSKDPVRLLVYLDVLRGKGGQKAQAAACLLCFDLARRGEPRFEAEMLALVPVMRGFVESRVDGESPLERLLGTSEYLHELWGDLSARLLALDPRYDHGAAEQVVDLEADVVEIELLDATDLAEIDLGDIVEAVSDDAAMGARWQEALDRFYSVDQGLRAMLAGGSMGAALVGGFFADEKAEVARVEALRDDAVSLAEHVSGAKELLPFIELFLAAHTRARNLFGRRNKARDASLRAGLEHFLALERPPPVGPAWLEPPTSGEHSWQKVAELLLDFVAWLGARAHEGERAPSSPALLAGEYVDAERPQPPPARLADPSVARRRR